MRIALWVALAFLLAACREHAGAGEWVELDSPNPNPGVVVLRPDGTFSADAVPHNMVCGGTKTAERVNATGVWELDEGRMVVMTFQSASERDCEAPFINKIPIEGLVDDALVFYPFGIDDTRTIEFRRQ